MLSICMVQHWIAAKPTAESERKIVMLGLLSALEGFCVIGIVIGTGYVAARMRMADLPRRWYSTGSAFSYRARA